MTLNDFVWLQPIAMAPVPVLLGAAYASGLKALKTHQVDTTLYEAVGRAGGVAYNWLLQSGRPVTDQAALKAAAAAGAEYLVQHVGETLLAKGVTNPAALAGAELGKLLAGDPTIMIGAPGTVTVVPVPEAEK